MGWGPCCGSGVGAGISLVEVGLLCWGTGMTCERLAFFSFFLPYRFGLLLLPLERCCWMLIFQFIGIVEMHTSYLGEGRMQYSKQF